ncbi:gas vesicle protein [Streptomyces sp. HNM0575]|uniref:gas vesicle protein GvpO n=1 Tax=Streptomyces sp. HNM0575 TaxID=2716338 RepID=UPI00145DF083|nr:gas vesicle protein [Streptomyces sp. HNM0575]NLU75398.1 gas vesicle protein [Streptomyces sp. HNM0575]
MATTSDKGREENKRQTGHKESASPPQRSQQQGRDRKQQDGSGGTRESRVPIAKAMRLAAAQLAELLNCEPASVSSVKPTDEGWTADVEVVEVERVPDTTSVMGSYRVQLDGQGNLLGYERTRRYARGQIDQRK